MVNYQRKILIQVYLRVTKDDHYFIVCHSKRLLKERKNEYTSIGINCSKQILQFNEWSKSARVNLENLKHTIGIFKKQVQERFVQYDSSYMNF